MAPHVAPGGGGDYASIDPSALKDATDSLQASVDGVDHHIRNLLGQFQSFGIDTTDLTTLTSVTSTISTLIPELRRRQHLAEHLEAEHPENGTVVSFRGDLLGQFQTVKAARAQAHIDAETVKHAREHGDNIPQELYSDLGKYGSDPDFASAFVKDLGPKSTAYLLLHVEHFPAIASLTRTASPLWVRPSPPRATT